MNIKKTIATLSACILLAGVGTFSACGSEYDIKAGQPATAAPVKITEKTEELCNKIKAQKVTGIKSEGISSATGTVKQGSKSVNIDVTTTTQAVSNALTGDFDSSSINTVKMDMGGAIISQNQYEYKFIRNFLSFSCSSTSEVTDFSKKQLTYNGTILDTYLNNLGIDGIGGATVMDTEVKPENNNALLEELLSNVSIGGAPQIDSTIKLAALTNCLTIDGKTVTFDLVNVYYAIAMQTQSLLASLTENTTLTQLLQNETVKTYIQAFTDGVSISEEYSSVLNAIKSLAPEGQTADLSAFAPKQNSTVYDYTLELLNSAEVGALLNCESTVGEIKLGDIIGVEAGGFTAVKTAILGIIPQIFTTNGIRFSSDMLAAEDQSFSLKITQAQTTLELNRKQEIESVQSAIKIKLEMVDLRAQGGIAVLNLHTEVNETQEYLNKEVQLKDISQFTTINSKTSESEKVIDIIAKAPSKQQIIAEALEKLEEIAVS
ncbi:MAG: hypothetical protein J6B04_04390 [Clostridia bacterium]|nr:hypothetical protein [Clostridia bacterium]